MQGLHRNGVVIMTALVAVRAMHGLSSDHDMGVPGGHMGTAMQASSATAGHVSAQQPDRSMAGSLELSVSGAVTAAVASVRDQMGHAGGMCRHPRGSAAAVAARPGAEPTPGHQLRHSYSSGRDVPGPRWATDSEVASLARAALHPAHLGRTPVFATSHPPERVPGLSCALHSHDS